MVLDTECPGPFPGWGLAFEPQCPVPPPAPQARLCVFQHEDLLLTRQGALLLPPREVRHLGARVRAQPRGRLDGVMGKLAALRLERPCVQTSLPQDRPAGQALGVTGRDCPVPAELQQRRMVSTRCPRWKVVQRPPPLCASVSQLSEPMCYSHVTSGWRGGGSLFSGFCLPRLGCQFSVVFDKISTWDAQQAPVPVPGRGHLSPAQ